MIASTKVTEKAEQRWSLIVQRFRHACVLHKEGERSESRRIVKEELPELIRAWIRLLPAALKADAKADLRDMFAKEQSIVEDGIKLQRIFKETLVKRIIPKVEEQIAAKYKALYIKEQRALQQTQTKDLKPSWSSSDYFHATPTLSKRVPLENVSAMIDAVQENEPNTFPSTLLPLDEIVGTLKRAKLDSILTA